MICNGHRKFEEGGGGGERVGSFSSNISEGCLCSTFSRYDGSGLLGIGSVTPTYPAIFS